MQHRFSPAICRTLVASIIGASLFASRAHADTITVCLDGSCDFTSPVAAVNAAIEGDVIEIAAGTYMLSAPISLYDKDLVIRGAVDANGRPTTVLNGQNTTYHINALHATAATTIENLVLTNGRGTNNGAIYMFGCHGTSFRNCSVRENRATYGGAIRLNGSSVTMTGCEILNNAAESGTSVGGGIYISGSVSLIDCVVSGNTATFSGGGIYVPGGAVVNLTRTRVCGNSAPQGAQVGQTSSSSINDLGGACVMTACANCPSAPCPADLNNDGNVNAADLSTVLASWGACGKACPADIDGNGMVDAADLSAVLAAWGACE
jgi:predicted outer membrane repeat protein